MIDFEERWLSSAVFKWRGSVAPRALWFALPAACISVLLLVLGDLAPDWRDSAGLAVMSSSVLWSSTTACVIFLVGFRSRQALGRFWEGTGLLHQMRGEWFDAASCLMTFSRGARGAKPKEVAEFRHTLVRLMSLMHGSALEEIKANHAAVYEVIDIRGLDLRTRNYLRDCKTRHGFNRVEVLLHMVQVLVTQNLDDGVLKVAPPILSRCYQTLSRGLVNLLNARKITDTKFPFPYVQLISTLLIFHAALTPVVITELVQHKAWAAVFTFMPVFGLFSLNFVAIELECPFGDDANDLPLEEFQKEMNSSLLMLLSDEADNVACTSPLAIDNVHDLTKALTKSSTGVLDRSSASSEVVNSGGGHRISQVFAGLSGPFTLARSHRQSDLAPSMFDFEDEDVKVARALPDVFPGVTADLKSAVGTSADRNYEEVLCDLGPMPTADKLAESSSTAPAAEPRMGPLARAGQVAPRNGNDVSRQVGAWNASDAIAERSASQRQVPLAAESRAPPDYDPRLTQWFEGLTQNTEAMRSLAAALPQLAAWESHFEVRAPGSVHGMPGEQLLIEVEANGDGSPLDMSVAPPITGYI